MNFNFNEWWDSLSTLQQIYWGFAIPFSLIFIFQMILTLFGSDSDSDLSTDTEIETDHGIGFQFFTFKNLVGFFTIFSWTGITCIDAGFSVGMTITISSFSGVSMMGLMGAIFYYFSQLTDSGTLDINNAKGSIGEVYLTIKGNKSNIGKVQIKVQGALRELDAITDGDDDLLTGSIIIVKEVINNNILNVSKSN